MNSIAPGVAQEKVDGMTKLRLALMMFIWASTAQAHFLLQYSPQTFIDRPGQVVLDLIFWHPMNAGHVMSMDVPQAFYMRHGGQDVDLLPSLTPFTFTAPHNSGTAYRGSVPIKHAGDYVIATIPAPYYEQAEDIYIQQITKSFLNRSGLPTDWDSNLGLPVEIMPLNKPYNVLAGSSFSGQVLANGEPVPFAHIEVEYISAEPNQTTNSANAAQITPPPGGALVVKADQNGVFTFGIPRAGHWGFAALDLIETAQHDGKKLSQDAVIWIRAWDLE